jgi:hypothetical protein
MDEVDSQTKMINKIIRCPPEFRKYGGLRVDMMPDLLTSDKVK